MLIPHSDYIKMIFERVLEKIIKLARQQIKAFNENNAADDIAISVSSASSEILGILAS